VSLRIFIGRDPRQPIAYNVLADSIIRHASQPVSITALSLKTLPIKRRGLTEFTFSRFLVPYLCNFEGKALFLDADMVVTGDIAELFACADGKNAVQVNTKQAGFEWPSAMLFNCEHCKTLTPEYVEDRTNILFDFKWGTVGEFPAEWNHCCGYAEPRLDAKLYHWTRGIPVWKETRGLKEDPVWHDAFKHTMYTCSYRDLMGNSVHAATQKSVVNG
jgi:hypothetical protein